MNRRENFLAAVAGEKVDRMPLILWLHFVTDYLDGAEAARLHARFFRRFDVDLAKVISDYRFPLPEGMETLASPADMGRIKPADMSSRSYAEQFRMLRVLRADLGKDWPLIDTTFDPIQQITRRVGSDKTRMIFDNPKESRPMIEAMTETCLRYARELKKIGVDGVLYSTHSAITEGHPKAIDDGIFKEFYEPYEKAVLEEMGGMVRILHPCQNHLDFDRVKDYPHEVLSWYDRDPHCPSLSEMRARSDKCLMGGVDHVRILTASVPDLRAEVEDALDQLDGRKMILAPGCTILSQVPHYLLDCVRQTADAWHAKHG